MTSEHALVASVMAGLIALIIWAFSDEHARQEKKPEPAEDDGHPKTREGWEDIEPASAHYRWVRGHLVVVNISAPDYRGEWRSGEWGFTVWDRGICLCGRSDPAWDLATAMREAEAMFGLLRKEA